MGLTRVSALLLWCQAVRAGTDWVELDIHATKCGELVVTHDIIFDHATNVAAFPEFRDRCDGRGGGEGGGGDFTATLTPVPVCSLRSG